MANLRKFGEEGEGKSGKLEECDSGCREDDKRKEGGNRGLHGEDGALERCTSRKDIGRIIVHDECGDDNVLDSEEEVLAIG